MVCGHVRMVSDQRRRDRLVLRRGVQWKFVFVLDTGIRVPEHQLQTRQVDVK